MARLTCPAIAAPVDGLPPFSPGAPGARGSVMWGPRDVCPKGKAEDALAGLGLLGSQTPFSPVSGWRDPRVMALREGARTPRLTGSRGNLTSQRNVGKACRPGVS